MQGSILDILDILQYVEYAKYVAIYHNIPNCILGIYEHTSGPARRAKHWRIRFFNLEAANPSSRKSRIGAQLEPGVVAQRQEVAGQ